MTGPTDDKTAPTGVIKLTERALQAAGVRQARAIVRRINKLSQADSSDEIPAGDIAISITRTTQGIGIYSGELSKLRDRSVVSALLGEAVRHFNAETDVAITNNGLPKGTCDSVRIVGELKRILGEPDSKNLTPKRLTIADKDITFQVVRRGSMFVWSTDRKSGQFLASLATAKLVSATTPNIPAPSKNEYTIFRANAQTLGISRNRVEGILALLPEPLPTSPDVVAKVGDHDLRFKVRVANGDFKWCVDAQAVPLLRHEELLPAIAQLVDPSAAVLPIHNPSKELVVSGPSFKKHCDVKGQLLDLWKKAAEGLEVSDSRVVTFTTNSGSKSLEISYRSLGGRPTLVITPRAIELVKSVEALRAIDPTAILPVELYEDRAISCSQIPLRELGIRNGTDFTKRLHLIIGEPPSDLFEEKRITVEGGDVRFFSVRSGSSFVWAVDTRDKQLFTSGNFFQAIYPEKHVTFSTKLMIPLTAEGLSRLGLNLSSSMRNDISQLINLLDSPEHRIPHFEASLGGGSIQCVMAADLDRLKAACKTWLSSLDGTASIAQYEHTIQRQELEATCPALLRFLDAESKSLKSGAVKHISIPALHLELKLIKTRAQNRVGFVLADIDLKSLSDRISQANPRSEAFRTAHGDYGVRVNIDLLKETHGCYRDLYAALNRQLGYQPFSPSAPLAVDLSLGALGNIRFHLPHDAPYDAWYVSPEQAELISSPAFAAALGVRSSVPYHEAEHLRLTRDQMQNRGVPNARPLAERLSLFLGNAGDYTGDLPVDIGPLQAFIVTLPGGHISWAIRDIDRDLLQHPEVESILFEGAIPPFNPLLHIAISTNGLAPFVRRSEDARDSILRLIEPSSVAKGVIEEQIEINGAIFQLPYTMRRSNTVLAIRKEDLPAIAEALEWTLREDLNNKELDQDSDLVSALSLLGGDERDVAAYLLLSRGEISSEELTLMLKKIKAVCRPSSPSASVAAIPILLERPEVTLTVEHNEGIPFLKVRGSCVGAAEIQLTGDASRRFEVASDGTFEGNLPIPGPRQIKLQFMAFNHDMSGRSAQSQIDLDLTALAGSIELRDEALLILLQRRGDIVEEIQANSPASTFRRNLLTRQVIRKMLRHFSKDEEEGFSHLESRIQNAQSKLSEVILKAVHEEFSRVREENFDDSDSKSLFFQKWGAYKIREAIRNGEKGIILSFDPGLGKTRTALLAVGGEKFLSIVPNSVVSFWASETRTVHPQSTTQTLTGPYADRDCLLGEQTEHTSLITNIEYVRQQHSGERIELLSRNICVVDEAHFLCNDGTAQSKAISNIRADFKLLLTATPFAQYSGIGPLLSHLTDNISYSRGDISRAFSPEKPEDLVVLHHLLSPHMIYLGKEDLFDIPSAEDVVRPSHTLPRKSFVAPENGGHFVISQEQLLSQIELIIDPEQWNEKHRPRATYEDRSSSCFRKGYFEFHAAVEQITNDPEYIGSNAPSPKHEAMRAIVEKEVVGNAAKIVIMCRYRNQVEKYAEMFDQYGVCTIWGGLPQNHRGEKVENGKVCRFATDEAGEFLFDHEGRLIPDPSGQTIQASDYQLNAFQRRADKRVLVATYDCAAVGITATAGQAMVFDQIPASHLILNQAMDRIHRLDATFCHPEVRYYFMISQFPDIDIDRLVTNLPAEKRDVVQRFLRQTPCEVDWRRVQRNGTIFSHIMNGRPLGSN